MTRRRLTTKKGSEQLLLFALKFEDESMNEQLIKPIYHQTEDLFGNKTEIWHCPRCGDSVAEKNNGAYGYRLGICAGCKAKLDWKK